MTNVKRRAFCLGCGDLYAMVEIPCDGYHAPPDTDVPGWCSDERCQAQRERFQATCDRILNGEK